MASVWELAIKVVTTIQCFQQMDDLEPSQRDNVILLIERVKYSLTRSAVRNEPTSALRGFVHFRSFTKSADFHRQPFRKSDK